MADPPRSTERTLARRLRAYLAPRTFATSRLGSLAAILALFGLALPWAVYSVPGTTTKGAAGLLALSSGLPVLGGNAALPGLSSAVWAILLILGAGVFVLMLHEVGSLVSAVGLALYLALVHAPLAARGAAMSPDVVFAPSWGFWITLAAVLVRGLPTLTALAQRVLARRRAGKAPLHVAAEAAGPAPVPAAAPADGRDLLTVRDLTVRFFTYDGVLKALDGVNFTVREREILGIVGETGCGKSVTAKAILRLIPDPPGRITGGEVIFEGINLLDSIEEEAKITVNAKGRAKVKRNRRIAKRMEAMMRTLRGNEISMIFQEPTAALNPVATIEEQIGETYITHQLGEICRKIEGTTRLSPLQRRFFARLKERERVAAELDEDFRTLSVKRTIIKAAKEAGDEPAAAMAESEVGALEQAVFRKSIRLGVLERRIAFFRRLPIVGKEYFMGPIKAEVHERVVEMLKQVNIPDPEKKAEAFPFELSGGMQQRAMIAMALACRPRLLLADEPTTALDVTIQAQILTLIRNLRDQFGSSVILITHDLGVVAETCERVGVMYAGVMAEIGQAADIFNRPKHPYTVGLLRSIPETYARTGKLSIIPGSVPSLLTPPLGCRFHPRCPFASDSCKKVVPVLSEAAPGQLVACHLYDHPEFFPSETIKRRDEGLDASWEKVVVP